MDDRVGYDAAQAFATVVAPRRWSVRMSDVVVQGARSQGQQGLGDVTSGWLGTGNRGKNYVVAAMAR
jgi:hypothetical protein